MKACSKCYLLNGFNPVADTGLAAGIVAIDQPELVLGVGDARAGRKAVEGCSAGHLYIMQVAALAFNFFPCGEWSEALNDGQQVGIPRCDVGGFSSKEKTIAMIDDRQPFADPIARRNGRASLQTKLVELSLIGELTSRLCC